MTATAISADSRIEGPRAAAVPVGLDNAHLDRTAEQALRADHQYQQHDAERHVILASRVDVFSAQFADDPERQTRDQGTPVVADASDDGDDERRDQQLRPELDRCEGHRRPEQARQPGDRAAYDERPARQPTRVYAAKNRR